MLSCMATLPALSTASYRPRWELGTVLAYIGALIAGIFANYGLYSLGERHRWWGLLTAVGLTIAYLGAAFVLARAKQLLATGLTALLAATALPWAFAALLRPPVPPNYYLYPGWAYYVGELLFHQPHSVAPRWIVVDLAALLVALLLLKATRFALLAIPAVFAVWFLGQELAALGASAASPKPGDVFLNPFTGSVRVAAGALVVSAVFFVVGVWLDRNGWKREALWPHIAAPLSLVVGLSELEAKYNHDVIVLVSVVLGVAGIVVALKLGRSAYGIFGGLVLINAGIHFAEKGVHRNSLGFAFVVGVFALIVGAIGVVLAGRSAAT
jgi:hypothetical protein